MVGTSRIDYVPTLVGLLKREWVDVEVGLSVLVLILIDEVHHFLVSTLALLYAGL